MPLTPSRGGPLRVAAPDAASVVNALVGTPYVPLGRSRAGLDCYGLVVLALGMAGRRVPYDPMIPPGSIRRVSQGFAQHLPEWTRCQPQEGAVALCVAGEAIYHAGVVLAGGILHANKPRGVEHVRLKDSTFFNAEFYTWL